MSDVRACPITDDARCIGACWLTVEDEAGVDKDAKDEAVSISIKAELTEAERELAEIERGGANWKILLFFDNH
jgi:hypothetical protein